MIRPDLYKHCRIEKHLAQAHNKSIQKDNEGNIFPKDLSTVFIDFEGIAYPSIEVCCKTRNIPVISRSLYRSRLKHGFDERSALTAPIQANHQNRGTQSYISDCDYIMKAWSYERNVGLSPNNITLGSRKKVWFKGKCGHEWQRKLNDILVTVKKSGKETIECPICNNKVLVSGINDLATLNPELAKEWHPTKNGDLLPVQVTANAHRKVWWLGKCGHEWETAVRCRNRMNCGCPICSRKNSAINKQKKQ